MATRYNYGRALEYRVRDDFESAEYFVVRSAGSRGAADLVALDTRCPGAPLLIQCKRSSAPLSVNAWNHLMWLSRDVRAVPLVAAERPGEPLVYDLFRITAERAPRSSVKPWLPWVLDDQRGS